MTLRKLGAMVLAAVLAAGLLPAGALALLVTLVPGRLG